VTGYRVCVRPMPADGRSIVGWLPGVEGMYVAVTHNGGTLGAHLAGLITAEVLGGPGGTVPGGTAPAGLAPFRPGRFTTGSPQPPAR
jgi:glycine/D-amino acid oxidase-like deaminating enzyme